MNDERDEIGIEDIRGPIRISVNNRSYANSVGIGFLWDPSGIGDAFVADLSGLKFRRIRRWTGPHFEASVNVSLDTIDRTIMALANYSSDFGIYQVAEAERKSAQAHVADLREVTRALLEMQKVIVGNCRQKENTGT